ncbi:hypothetical protein PHYBLDRAFT_65024 [Phycomyces blakesleeanus NRRL 1555(-)]|uniref:Uncharacterized protein n=1 Tax=Phycomyces blakesleeanus (strain ATCC 8743b / DSM 1359 / FGSC 10004 / NBRC 33097 / NRRL 1555) TaxID=763407 RepID=A0A162PI24_PHYB8|nr:hypothetical protein PHYBLDRAFT_65024 [Phycomyces blakesleeanus NRRL 1555(-)]OAD73047.1 hypothetical protein PHYBLDRAFT_65024 [Phycomyces blakesleeanus NRRL 1555(-)]|eukprot:XP_018291087.1 hypothetical protein PHYBLDRAFT_65024 [Phycomyces blakesleeanus NRRL 1555(-)]
MGGLTNAFLGLELRNSLVQHFMASECNLSSKKIRLDNKIPRHGHGLTNYAFIDEFVFHINSKRSYEWALKARAPVTVVPVTRARSATIMGAMAIHGVVKITVRKPNPPSNKKRQHAEDGKKKMGTGTNTDHYV